MDAAGMCFDWCFGTRVLPSYRDSNMPAVRDCVARKRSYTVTRFKARQFLFTRTPDPLRTRSVRRASDSVQTAFSDSGLNWSAIVRQPHIIPNPNARTSDPQVDPRRPVFSKGARKGLPDVPQPD